MIGNLNSIFKQKAKVASITYDADAQAYFTANTAITSSADKNAINTFYLGLKTDGIYTKIKAMYLPIWGSAASSKWNLVNPLDTNAAYRLTFSTGWTFSSSGATPNGTSAYGDTFIIPSTNLNLNNTHLSIYSRTNNFGNYADIGCGGSGGLNTDYLQILAKWSDNNFYGLVNDTDFTTNTVTNSLGLFCTSRTTSTLCKNYRNGSLITTKTVASTSRSAMNLIIGARNLANGGITSYSNRQYSFTSIGDGLTDAEATNFYNRVQTLMTYFAINV